MADNVKVKPSTAGTAINLATDEIDGVHHPKYKLEFGADGTATEVDADNPLPTASSSADVVRSNTLQESIDQLVIQMKIMNAYNAMGFDETITEDDIL